MNSWPVNSVPNIPCHDSDVHPYMYAYMSSLYPWKCMSCCAVQQLVLNSVSFEWICTRISVLVLRWARKPTTPICSSGVLWMLSGARTSAASPHSMVWGGPLSFWCIYSVYSYSHTGIAVIMKAVGAALIPMWEASPRTTRSLYSITIVVNSALYM